MGFNSGFKGLIVNAVPIFVGFHSMELRNPAVSTDIENK